MQLLELNETGGGETENQREEIERSIKKNRKI